MKLYVKLITDENGDVPESAPVHGVDYRKGHPCGRSHEFHTRNCKPVVFTQDDVDSSKERELYVELTPFRSDVVHVDTDGTMNRGVVWGE
jgi:hypothetical protein